MEPPSSINNRESLTDPYSDDPLAKTNYPDSYLIVTRPESMSEVDDNYYICACWAGKGVTYLGKTDMLGS